jgi:hypothetical protein
MDQVTRIELAKSCLEGKLSAVREAPGLEPLTGLEPAWINVRSVAPFQLGYRGKDWSDRRDLNPRSQPWQGCAIPDYATAALAQGAGIEPAMFCLTGRRQQPTLVP